jgi:hypothetical protein
MWRIVGYCVGGDHTALTQAHSPNIVVSLLDKPYSIREGLGCALNAVRGSLP